MSDSKNLRKYHEQLNKNKFENKVVIDDFLGKYRLPKLTQENMEKLERPIFIKGIENIITRY